MLPTWYPSQGLPPCNGSHHTSQVPCQRNAQPSQGSASCTRSHHSPPQWQPSQGLPPQPRQPSQGLPPQWQRHHTLRANGSRQPSPPPAITAIKQPSPGHSYHRYHSRLLACAAFAAIVAAIGFLPDSRDSDNNNYYSNIDAITAITGNRCASIPAITAPAATNDYDDVTDPRGLLKPTPKDLTP